MDDAAEHFSDIFGGVDDLINGDFDEDKIGVLEFAAKGSVQEAGVSMSGVHTRLPDGKTESSLGVAYDGQLGGIEYTLNTNLNPGESTEVEITTARPILMNWPCQGLLFRVGLKSEFSNGADGDSSQSVDIHVEKNDFRNTLTIAKPEPHEGLQLTNSTSYGDADGNVVGAAFTYNGGAAKFAQTAVSAVYRFVNASLSFLLTSDFSEDTPAHTFSTGLTFDVSEKLQVGGMCTTESGSGKHDVALGGRYEVSDTCTVKGRFGQNGLYGLVATVLLSAHLTATLLIQQGGSGSGPATKAGVVLSYDDSEDADAQNDDAGGDDAE